MAKISFNEVEFGGGEHTSSANNVGIFSLKNDGDEAIVRIMHDSVDDFDILTTHPITLNGKYRSVSCLREPREPIDKCPLCKSGAKVNTKIFVHMIQYVVGDNGTIEPKPVVWERSASVYAPTLKNYINEYGPLSDCVFKIRRRGAKGDMSTTYDILFGNPNMYKEDIYPKVPDAFSGYSVSGGLVLSKSASEIEDYLSTGSFPENKRGDGFSSSRGGNIAGATEDNLKRHEDDRQLPNHNYSDVATTNTTEQKRPIRFY